MHIFPHTRIGSILHRHIIFSQMADTPSSSILGPSSSPSTPNTQSSLPNLSDEVRSAMPGLEGAIEVTSTQASGTGDDAAAKAPAPVQNATSLDAKPLIPKQADLSTMPEDTLVKETHKRITQLLANLDATAEKIKRSNSKSKASNFARIVANMRQLNNSLGTLYRMSVEKVRELYTQLR